MKSKNKLKEIDIKSHVCYYFDDMIIGTKISFNNILVNKKLYECISIYNISYESPIGTNPLRIMFDEIDKFMISLDRKIEHL